MTLNTSPETTTGERIEELQQMAGDHMFMHAAQINDWRGNLKVYVTVSYTHLTLPTILLV